MQASRKSEALSRLVSDLLAPLPAPPQSQTTPNTPTTALSPLTITQISAVLAGSLSRGISGDLLTSLKSAQTASETTITDLCHSQHERFTASMTGVAKISPLITKLNADVSELTNTLLSETGAEIVEATTTLARHKRAERRGKQMKELLKRATDITEHVDKARTAAKAGRLRAALDHVDVARHLLTLPLSAAGAGVTKLQGSDFGRHVLECIPGVEKEVLDTSRRELNVWFGEMRKKGGGVGGTVLRESNRLVRGRTAPRMKGAADEALESMAPVSLSVQGAGEVGRREREANETTSFTSTGVLMEGEYHIRGYISHPSATAPTTASTLVPTLLATTSSAADVASLHSLNTHAVGRARVVYNLLQKGPEFKEYYEKNRYGLVKVQGVTPNANTESALSSLAGADVTTGGVRKFHGKVLAPVISLVVGFATQEAALMVDEDRPGDKEGRYKMESYTVRAGQSSACYEKSLINEVGELARFYTRASTTTELARMSRTLLGLFVALTAVHPGSGCRRNDAASLTLEFKVVEEVFEEEFGLICDKIIVEDTYEGVLKEDGVVLPFGLPYGLDLPDETTSLNHQSQSLSSDLDMLDPTLASRRARKEMVSTAQGQGAGTQQQPRQEARHSFSNVVLRLLTMVEGEVVKLSWVARNQMDVVEGGGGEWSSLPLQFAGKCLKEFCERVYIMVGDEDVADKLQISQAVQIAGNVQTLRNVAPCFLGGIVRGGMATGLVRRKEEATLMFEDADDILKEVQRACDRAEGAARDAAFQIARSKIDQLMSFSVEEAEWCEKAVRTEANEYCDQLINFLRVTFSNVGMFRKVDKEGFCFGCTGHIASRIMGMAVNGAGEYEDVRDGEIPFIQKINAYGVMNLSLDVAAFQSFADGCGVPQLSECFRELKCFTDGLLDKDLVGLCEEGRADERMMRYPVLDLLKLKAVLEKYQGVGMGAKLMGGSKASFLMLEKKEIGKILSNIKDQI